MVYRLTQPEADLLLGRPPQIPRVHPVILVLPIAAIALVLGAVKRKNIATPEHATHDVFSLVLSALGIGLALPFVITGALGMGTLAAYALSSIKPSVDPIS